MQILTDTEFFLRLYDKLMAHQLLIYDRRYDRPWERQWHFNDGGTRHTLRTRIQWYHEHADKRWGTGKLRIWLKGHFFIRFTYNVDFEDGRILKVSVPKYWQDDFYRAELERTIGTEDEVEHILTLAMLTDVEEDDTPFL